MKSFIKKIVPVLKNKYFLTGVAFLTLLIFFDKNNWITQYKQNKRLSKLKEEKAFYEKEVQKNQESIHLLQSNPENLEKYGRENYIMKKDNEDVFLIIPHEEK